MSRGVKEISEVLEFVQELGVAGVKAAKDGLGIEDIPTFLDPSLFGKAKDAIDGLSEVDDELKDLDPEEAKVVLGKLSDLFFAIKGSLKDEAEAESGE
jgi:hypothetical protein